MKIEEIYRAPSSDSESTESEDHTALQLSAVVSFAHGEQLEEAFEQLAQLPAFAQAIEKGLAELFRSTITQFVRQSSIAPGSGWTDDYTVEAQVHPRVNDFND